MINSLKTGMGDIEQMTPIDCFVYQDASEIWDHFDLSEDTICHDVVKYLGLNTSIIT